MQNPRALSIISSNNCCYIKNLVYKVSTIFNALSVKWTWHFYKTLIIHFKISLTSLSEASALLTCFNRNWTWAKWVDKASNELFNRSCSSSSSWKRFLSPLKWHLEYEEHFPHKTHPWNKFVPVRKIFTISCFRQYFPNNSEKIETPSTKKLVH